MKKILVIGDLHLGTHIANEQVNQAIPAILQEIIDIATSQEVDTVVAMGDLIHASDKIAVKDLHLFISFIADLQRNEIEFATISGNHDLQRQTDSFWQEEPPYTTGKFFAHAFKNQITLLDNTVIDGYGGVPFYRNSSCFYKAVERLREVHGGKLHTIFVHQSPKGFCFGEPSDMIDPKHSLLRGLRVFCGHIHAPNIDKSFIQTGAVVALNRSEAGQKYVFLVTDSQTLPIPLQAAAEFERVQRELPTISQEMVSKVVKSQLSYEEAVKEYANNESPETTKMGFDILRKTLTNKTNK